MRCWFAILAFAFFCSAASAAEPPRETDSATAQEIEQLIDQLGSLEFQEREDAQKRLIKIGPVAKPNLQRALSSTDPEIANRARAVLRSFVEAMMEQAEVHVVGLYESRAAKAIVKVKPTEHPIILVLCAYSSVTWEVQMPQDAQVLQIILSGYHTQSITDVDVPVTSLSYDQRTPGYFFAYCQDEKRFPEMVKRVHEMTGKVPKTFQGRYGFKEKPFVVPFVITLE